MKRIILSVFAAALTAAWAVPAHAVDITFSGQYRLRGEYRNDADFNKSNQDSSDFWGQRVRLTTNVKATDDTSVKITLQDTRNWGQEGLHSTGGPALTMQTGTAIDVHEAYVNVNNLFGAPVYLRAGRQELSYGDERLVGAFGWSNQGRAFDALKLGYTSDLFNVDAWWSKLTEANATGAGGKLSDVNFYGVYATVKAIPHNTVDLYALIVNDGNVGAASSFNGGAFGGTAVTNPNGPNVPTSGAALDTFGVRVKGEAVGINYDVELPFQTGDKGYNFDKTSAWALAAKADYTLQMNMKPTVGIEYDYASGTPTGATQNKTFYNLFPTNHNKLGIMDYVGWRNVSAFNVNVSAEPMEKVKLYAAFWNFSKAQKADGWYGAGNWDSRGTNSVSTLGGQSKSLGNEIDLVGNYKYNNALSGQIGYGHFFVGKAIKDAVTPNQTGSDWAYLMLTANF